nr:MAG TPA: hypothetical protein [Caudoviricetes sp.]
MTRTLIKRSTIKIKQDPSKSSKAAQHGICQGSHAP